jgi:hypothetical protein
MLTTLISLLGGGLMRLLPELVALWQTKQDNSHELAMLQAQVELEKIKSANKQAEAITQGAIDEAMAGLNATISALQGQMQKTGITFVDALNFLVRPVVTYLFLSMFCIYKCSMMIVALQQPDMWHSISAVYTADDAATLSGILSFWFVGRVFDKKS